MTSYCRRCGVQFVHRPRDRRKFCSQDCYHRSVCDLRDAEIAAGTKHCARCHQVKDRSEFSPCPGRVDRLHDWCKRCRSADESQRRKAPHIIERYRRQYENDMRFRAQKLLCSIGKKCRRERLAFDLDVDWLERRLAAGRCELTGIPFNMSVAGRRRNAFTPSIDRIVAGGGYTKSNCRVVIYALNAAMNDWGLDVVYQVAEALLARRLEVAS
jgi:hypothetical protein